jgi:hypothetical protein
LFFPLNLTWTPQHALVLGLMLFLGFSLVSCVYSRSREAILIVLVAIIPVLGTIVLSNLGRSVTSPQYLLFAYPFFLAAVAHSMARWVSRAFYVIAIAVLLLNSALIVHRYCDSVNPRENSGVKGAAEYLRSIAQTHDPVLVLHPCILSPLRVYLGPEWNIQLCAPREPIPKYLGTAILRKDDFLKAEDTPNGTGIWVADCTGYGYHPHYQIPQNWVAADDHARAFRGVVFFERFVTVRRFRVANP